MRMKLWRRIRGVPWLFPAVRWAEALIFGTRLRGALLEGLLRHHHLSRFYRDWYWTREKPHFEDHHNFLQLWRLTGEASWPLGRNPDFLIRGTLNRELIRPDDDVLDIACGDGFFDASFYSGAARRVDALDIDPEALARARRHHRAPNVLFHRLDAVKDPFPGGPYRVIFWDGAIAHFTEAEVGAVMEKVRGALAPGGVLAGSEALEPPQGKSWDHHLAFAEPEDLKPFLLKWFPCVAVKEIPPIRGRYREVYFRCALTPEAIAGCAWR